MDEDVPGGTYTLKMATSMKTLNFKGDLCKQSTFDISVMGMSMGQLVFEGMKCPLKAGAQSVDMTATLSASIPTFLASSTITLNAKATNGDALLCLTVHTK